MRKVPEAGSSKVEQHPFSSSKSKLLIGIGVAVALAATIAGVCTIWMAKSASTETSTISTVRPSETIRIGASPEQKAKANPTAQPAVQSPQGTVKRMEAIQGAFSKK